jgi:hypothetical protein
MAFVFYRGDLSWVWYSRRYWHAMNTGDIIAFLGASDPVDELV